MRSLFGELARGAAMVVSAALATVLVWGSAAPAPLRSWRDGPVRVLLDHDEYERYGALRTDDERRDFVERFWRELDANPTADGKAFRSTFEERCAIANLRFQTIREEGWQTDRGRVFLALGEPAAVRQESGGLKAVAKEVWIYGTPGDPAASLEIAFYRCADGSYRTDPSCLVAKDPSSVSFDWERNNYLRTLRDSNPGLSSIGVRQLLNDLLATLPVSVPRTGAAPSTSGGSAVAGVKAPDDLAPSAARLLDVMPYYFRAQDGSVLAFITMNVHQDAAAAKLARDTPAGAYLAAASFEEAGKHGQRLPSATAHAAVLDPIATTGGLPQFFGRAYLESGGTYAARYALKDDARGEILVKNEVLTVPDLGSGFSASSLVPAERFGPAGSGAGRYQVGSEEVVPKPDASFRRSELLRLYVQVYGAAIDPERRSPRVDVVFRFQRVVKGALKRFGKPFSVREAAGGALGLALPIGDWPTGPYSVTVDLHDRVGGERISVAGAFTVLED